MTGAVNPGFVDVGGRRIRHRVLGDGGPVVVMVHGFGGSLDAWGANQAALAAGGRTVASLDLPGHGESSLDVGSGSLDELASCVRDYLDAIGADRVHLVGHSMGAAVCLALADAHPGRVQSLTLVGPAGFGQKINADFIRGLVAARSREELEPLMRQLYADPGRVRGAEVQQLVVSKQRAGAVEALARIASSRYGGTPSGRALREVAGSVPTLILWGAADTIVPPPPAEELARDGVLVHVLPGRGHMVQVEAADEVNRLIGDFVGR
jgi:pyruvate dehydrogenase E2 component (dihydrolipoamide acetyltransferase)